MKSAPLIAGYPVLVSNVRAAYYAARQYPSLFHTGLDWYYNAQKTAGEIAKRYNVSIEIACGVLSALSPNIKWQRTILCTDVIFAYHREEIEPSKARCDQYVPNRQKAYDIIDGLPPLEILGENKTRSFM